MSKKQNNELADLIYQHSPMSHGHSDHLADVLSKEGYQKRRQHKRSKRKTRRRPCAEMRLRVRIVYERQREK